jgi:hypothetical protein
MMFLAPNVTRNNKMIPVKKYFIGAAFSVDQVKTFIIPMTVRMERKGMAGSI